ncbi:hypothetical protein IDJ77_09010 [Mucilaginibacter sp. ZT4R22]|uniref:Auto-transporter adhesin head GIN domain-containing protein n=1 Tax=Mucilaginibacter pankratovii TaxID=2772110 RepID=A0ABR7WNP8_9SPHI|nr:hypothetical protein [Mucilaginibacter pankratovii]MBD1363946.1 hypothetical protein [Mucilaginibacter pankratovii]
MKTKISTIILRTLFAVMLLGVVVSDLAFKNVYNKVDKSDTYWNYNKILEQPFKHLKLDGGNITKIVFQQSKHASVRVLNYWDAYRKDVTFKAYVKNDTLHLVFPNKYKNEGEKNWMQNRVLVRLFAPELLSVEGTNTNFELQKLRQANITVNLKGKSRLEVESYNQNFDTLRITQADSSQVLFEMAPELKGSKNMHFGYVAANLKDYTILDIGHGFAENADLAITDSSAVILSGKSLKAMKMNK